MEIILKQNIDNLGNANDIVKVKNGYARNYLFPQQLAIPATESNKKILAENIKQKAHKEEKIRKEAETLAAKLSDIVVKIGTKASETGKIFGSVTNVQIAEAIQAQFEVEIDRKKISIAADHIKELGNYEAKINIYKDIKAVVKLEIFAE